MQEVVAMKKVFCALLSAVLCLPLLVSPSDAAHKAFDYFGFYDRSGKLKESDRAKINTQLKDIYDKYGVSVYMNIMPDDSMKVENYLEHFYIESVAPYAGEIKRGIIFVWNEKKNNYYGAPFPNTDDRVMSAFSPKNISLAVSSSLKLTSSVFGASSKLAVALQKIADEYYGANPTGKVVKAPTNVPGPTESDMAMAKDLVYTIDGEKFPSIYGVVSKRDIIAAQSGREGKIQYFMTVYKTGSIEDDIAKYFKALDKDGWLITNQQGNYDKGSASVAKLSKDEGHILALTVEFRGVSYQVNAAKLPGTLNVNKQPTPPVQ